MARHGRLRKKRDVERGGWTALVMAVLRRSATTRRTVAY